MFQINHSTICRGQYQKSSSPYCLEKFAIICFGRIWSSLDIPVLIKFLVLIACLPELV